MSLDQYHHGVRVIEINEGARPIRTINTSIIGLVATANDADADFFPLDTPVLVTNVYAAMAKAGTQGTLARTLDAIAAQARPVCIIVRVNAPSGESVGSTTANVIGGVTSGGQYTGMKALLTAQAKLGIKPRILGAPGLDNQAVTTALVALAQQLRGFVYASCDDAETIPDAVTYRNQFAARELMLIYPDFRHFETTYSSDGVASSGNADAPAAAYALGLRAKIDNEIGWHKTLSNVAVNGVTGISRDVFWDLQSSESDAGVLNAADVTTLINSSGYKFWGSRTCSDDPLFKFESATRTAQVLADTIAEAHLWAVDKPLHPSIVKDILESVNAKFRSLKTAGYILDANAWYDDEINSTTTLSGGQLVIDYDFTPIPPIEDLAFRQRITDRYFGDFGARVAAS